MYSCIWISQPQYFLTSLQGRFLPDTGFTNNTYHKKLTIERPATQKIKLEEAKIV
jgi:hypothetical protein